MPAFVIVEQQGKTERFACKEVTTMGRDRGNDIVLDDTRVSRRHAMICKLQDDAYYLIDEGSSNGTYLNAKRVTLPARLKDKDHISIGSIAMRFEQIGTAPPAEPRSTDTRTTTVIVAPKVEIVQNAILVADIRGFTRLSESMPVRNLTELMNEWFRASTMCIKERYGIIDKFLGDCVYARWEATGDSQRAVWQAIDAACQLHRASEKINVAHPELPQRLSIGVGINFGIAAIGTDQGSTAIGDAVNLTFRLQEQTKYLRKNILIAEDAYCLLPEASWLGKTQSLSVAGKTHAVNVCGFSFDEAEQLMRQSEETRYV